MGGSMSSFSLKPLSSALGAEVIGIDMHRPLDAETVQVLIDAWHRYIILLFRLQPQLRCARRSRGGAKISPSRSSRDSAGDQLRSRWKTSGGWPSMALRLVDHYASCEGFAIALRGVARSRRRHHVLQHV